jgi:serpin B
MKKYIIILFIVLLAASCTNQNEPKLEVKDAEPIQLSVALEKRVAQDNDFAFDLFKKTIEDSGETNVFVSPLSVSIALGMAWNGATGETKTEMASALKMSGLSVDEINEYYKIMQTTLPAIDPTTKLSIANSLWYREGFPVKSDFLKINTDYFNAEVRELDFAQAWAVDTINNWCARNTNNLIKEVIDEIPGDAVMYLINAVHFKGIWRKQFDKKKTVEMNFTNQTGNTLKVNMMHQQDTFAYAQDELAQYLDMPYGNKAFSMTVILPVAGKTTDDVLNYLTVNNWNDVLQGLSKTEVNVFFPRFKSKNKFQLNEPLKNMGMQRAFQDWDEFRNIADARLLISRVLHDTFVEVTEEGTEAAAVTVVEVVLTSVPVIPDFVVNKPFIFIIREQSTGVILFIGKMGNLEKY